MKLIKLFYHGKHIKNISLKATPMQLMVYRIKKTFKSLLMRSAKVCVVAWIVVGSVHYMQTYHPTVALAYKDVIKEIETPSPVMERISHCESNGSHLNKSGQVVVKVNTNGTYDTGKYQINSIWNKKATQMGLNLSNEKDNEAFAMYLYKNYGTVPWNSSINCWNK